MQRIVKSYALEDIVRSSCADA